MSDLKQARKMIDLSAADLKAAENMLNEEAFTDAIFGFHAQQAVEKAFKAWISLRSMTFPITHDLKVLYRQLEEAKEPGLSVFLDLIDLTDFAVEFRYEICDDELIERATTLEEVKALVGHVQKLIQKAEEAG